MTEEVSQLDKIREGKYYVYELSNSLSGEVFYVGKGQKDRLNDHKKNALRGESSWKSYYIRKLIEIGGDVVATKVEFFEEESKAFEFEKQLIDGYGLENLVNILPGGVISQEKLDRIKRKREKVRSNAALRIANEKSKKEIQGVQFAQRLRNRIIFCMQDVDAVNMVGSGMHCLRLFADFIGRLDEDVKRILLKNAGIALKKDSKNIISLEVLQCPEAA